MITFKTDSATVQRVRSNESTNGTKFCNVDLRLDGVDGHPVFASIAYKGVAASKAEKAYKAGQEYALEGQMLSGSWKDDDGDWHNGLRLVPTSVKFIGDGDASEEASDAALPDNG